MRFLHEPAAPVLHSAGLCWLRAAGLRWVAGVHEAAGEAAGLWVGAMKAVGMLGPVSQPLSEGGHGHRTAFLHSVRNL